MLGEAFWNKHQNPQPWFAGQKPPKPQPAWLFLAVVLSTAVPIEPVRPMTHCACRPTMQWTGMWKVLKGDKVEKTRRNDRESCEGVMFDGTLENMGCQHPRMTENLDKSILPSGCVSCSEIWFLCCIWTPICLNYNMMLKRNACCINSPNHSPGLDNLFSRATFWTPGHVDFCEVSEALCAQSEVE